MKRLPVLLLNVATVTIALVARSAFDTDTPSPSDETESTASNTSVLEGRLDALETERRSSRRTRGMTDAQMLDRLKALEGALHGGLSRIGSGLARAQTTKAALSRSAGQRGTKIAAEMQSLRESRRVATLRIRYLAGCRPTACLRRWHYPDRLLA